MNRVKDYYELACDYLSLTVYGRYLVATHFKLVEENIFASNRDNLDRTVFMAIAEKEIFDDFKKFLNRYKKIEASHYGSHNTYLN